MQRTRILLFLASFILVPLCTYFVILFARGYRLNWQRKQLSPTGLLVATSLPDGAQIHLNGQLSSATNTTLNLPPATYRVEIKKDGFSPWTKTLKVEAEIVTRAAATLFPSVPSLKAITSGGAANPLLSPDGTKVVFTSGKKAYLLDLSESPLGLINREAREIATTSASWIVPTPEQLAKTATLRANALHLTMQAILATAAANLDWSPKENKLLYTATASASIPEDLIKPLPGSSFQPQSRALAAGETYVYDLEEDRNFKVPSGVSWFPDSAHLILTEKGKITILEYDSQNATVVYAGPMENTFAFPYPSGKQLLILANLSSNSKTSVPNLYAVSLR